MLRLPYDKIVSMKSYTKRRSWTMEQLKMAVKNSTSFRQVIEKLGLRAAGGNYEQLKKICKRMFFGYNTF